MQRIEVLSYYPALSRVQAAVAELEINENFSPKDLKVNATGPIKTYTLSNMGCVVPVSRGRYQKIFDLRTHIPEDRQDTKPGSCSRCYFADSSKITSGCVIRDAYIKQVYDILANR